MKTIRRAWWRFLLSLLSFPFWSRAWGRIVRIRRLRFLSRRMIRSFAKSYAITMDEYVGRPEDYACLADFFVRPLDPAKRRIDRMPGFFLSPADGRLSSLEKIATDICMQVKGESYPLSRVLGEAPDFSLGWHVAVIYLAPHNYHRFHCPVDADVRAMLHAGKRLFPVNALSVGVVPRLYIRNERYSVKLSSGGRTFYYVPVGATFVGSIRLSFIQAPMKRGRWEPVEAELEQGAEMGRFEQGSTIVLAIPAAMAGEWLASPGDEVRAGEPLFRIRE